MEENKLNLTDLEAEKARKMEILNEMNKLKFNTASSEEITNDMFNSISSTNQEVEKTMDETPIEDKATIVENKIENTNVELKQEKEVIEPVKEESTVVEKEVKPQMDNSKIEQQKSMKESLKVSYFDGKLLDLMGWNFLRIVLTVRTLGIGYAWGECLYLKYKLGHTVLNEKRLKFEGDGSQLFVENFKWSFLTLITFGIYGFWVPVKRINWVVSNIHFEDEEFNTTDTVFYGSMLRLLGINILCALIIVISLGILTPLAECIKLRWLAKNTIINNRRVQFRGKTLSLYGKYISWAFLTLITLGIYGFWVGIKKINWEVENTKLM